MKETEMGYRGSKSVSTTVKEQRVDGSWDVMNKNTIQSLRCTLMGFERNYPNKIPSNQLRLIKLF
jgi:hypothetical protein